MTGQAEAVLRALLADLCVADETEEFVRRWGRRAPSETRPDGVRVICPEESPFAALEIRPWDGESTGAVDVELRPRVSLEWPSVREAFGPFEELPPTTVGEEWHGATWRCEEGSASALLMVLVEGDEVTGISVRRDA